MTDALIASANAFFEVNTERALQDYFKLAADRHVLSKQLWVNAYFAREKTVAKRKTIAGKLTVAVACWDLSHNAAGRAANLCDLCQSAGINVSLIGAIFHKSNTSLWAPLSSVSYPLHYFTADRDHKVYLQMRDFVLQHPFDVVIVSKPRLVSLLFALLYKLVWGSAVIFDIDDEELGFIKNNQPIQQAELRALLLDAVNSKVSVTSEFWTRVAVSMATMFDQITVSNPALQARYGGVMLPHLRDASRFKPALADKYSQRHKLGLSDNDVVVLFFGTPRRRKGLLETAQAIAAVNDPRLVFLIAGEFPEPALKQELLLISGVRYVFLPDQPYDKAEQIVNLGDICILMQDTDDVVAQFQLPAKLIDALAIGLKLFIRETPAINGLVDPTFYTAVTEATLAEALSVFLAKNAGKDQSADWALQSYQYFNAHFSMQAKAGQVSGLIEAVSASRHSLPLQDFWPALTYEPDMAKLLLNFAGFILHRSEPLSRSGNQVL